MKKFLIILAPLTFYLTCCDQEYKKFDFNEIGFSIKIPRGYIIQDKFSKPKYVEANGNPVTDSTKIRELEEDLMKGLMFITTTDRANTLSFNIALETSRTGNFEKYWDFSKTMQLMMSRQQMAYYDSATTILTVNNIKIHKFLTYSTKENLTQYSGVYVGKVKNYYLIIKTDYADKKFGELFDTIILSSKFE